MFKRGWNNTAQPHVLFHGFVSCTSLFYDSAACILLSCCDFCLHFFQFSLSISSSIFGLLRRINCFTSSPFLSCFVLSGNEPTKNGVLSAPNAPCNTSTPVGPATTITTDLITPRAETAHQCTFNANSPSAPNHWVTEAQSSQFLSRAQQTFSWTFLGL